jgi:uncharacterized membrane protein
MNARRTEALSDSTFAVAMTLLIFDVRLPVPKRFSLSHDLWFASWPHYLGYVTSFVVIGMIWLSHHTIFRLLRAVDHRLMLLNLALLGLVVFIPFPTQILALYVAKGTPGQQDLAVAFYGLSLAAATFMLAALWHAAHRRPKLIVPWVEPEELRHVTRRFYATPLLYLVSTAFALVDFRLGLALFLVVGCGYLLHTGTKVAPQRGSDDDHQDRELRSPSLD